MNSTIDYYNKNASCFIAGTVNVNITSIQDKFLSYLQPGAKILDFGCGTGRDTKYFIEKGYIAEAIDGSNELCKYASQYTGIQVKQMLFTDLKEISEYDGIWACASILHLDYQELKHVFSLISNALKPHGIFYTSFKYGDYRGFRNGRYFTDMNENLFADFLNEFTMLSICESWISTDARPDRDNEKWLNLIMQKR